MNMSYRFVKLRIKEMVHWDETAAANSKYIYMMSFQHAKIVICNTLNECINRAGHLR
jgi:hypothetical protein